MSYSCADTTIDCQNWPVYPTTDPLIFWPPPSDVTRPTAIIPSLPVDILLDLNLTSVTERDLVMVRVLRVGGKSQLSLEDTTADYVFLTLTNKDGDPVYVGDGGMLLGGWVVCGVVSVRCVCE